MTNRKPLVVITGASSGIGAATAKLFSEKGHPLLLLARRVQKIKDLQLPDTLCLELDIRDRKLFKQHLETAEKEFGPSDCLINNAGIMLLGEVSQQDPKEWEDMFQTNVIGLLNGIHGVVQGMKDRNNGTIINVSSIAGKNVFENHAVYCGTKFAVHSISEQLRKELSNYNCRVTTIAPGAVETELLGHTTNPKIIDGYQKWKDEMGGVLQSEDVANAIYYAYQQPKNVCIREIALAPTRQEP